ncbi:MAG TPA: hypothetical protein VMI06_01585 [Terriglobia bacterium]|nr:hypothetical protein [Terriglobia bacterium]
MVKKMTHGINGNETTNPTLISDIGDAANQTWHKIQAWQGKEAPSDVSFEVQKAIVRTAGERPGSASEPAGSFTAAEQSRRAAKRDSQERG